MHRHAMWGLGPTQSRSERVIQLQLLDLERDLLSDLCRHLLAVDDLGRIDDT